MTLYELVGKVSAILTPETNSFYDRALWYADDDSALFLHGYDCRRSSPVPDREIPPTDRAVAAFRQPFPEGAEEFQLFFRYDGFWTTELCAVWSLGHRFSAVYAFDLCAMTCVQLDPARPLITDQVRPSMTLYGLIEKISAILTPETNSFYDYVLRSTDDDGGFLRTRFCLWDAPAFWNREIPPLEEAVVCFRDPFQEDYGSDTDRVKLQLFYHYDKEKDRSFCVSWSRDVGYPVPYLFDLRAGTYRILEPAAADRGPEG